MTLDQSLRQELAALQHELRRVNDGLERARSRELVRTPGRPVGWREILVLAALLLLALLAALAKRWRGRAGRTWS